MNPELLINGDYTLTQSMSRNSIFRIQHQNHTGLFVKQLINQDQTNSYLMQKDATCHFFIHESELYKETSKYIPKYYGYDIEHNILVTEYFIGTRNIHEDTFDHRRFSELHVKKIAQILNSYHIDIRKEIKEHPSLQFFSGMLPWILNMNNLNKPQNKGPVNSVVTEIHKHSDLVKKIDSIASKWEKYSLIHGDIKWMNFILLSNKEDIKLIDWEIADIGDPLWDVAGLFQSYLSSWALSFDNQKTSHQKVAGTEFIHINAIIPILKCFWEEYSKLQGFSEKENDEKIIKTLEYSAVRMIQTAFENNVGRELSSNSVRAIQFCDHLLTNTKSIAKDWNLL